jgi:histidine phosphotransfer protein HptB
MIIDAVTFRELQQAASPEFVTELVDAFLEEGPKMLSEMQTAWTTQSAERFKRAAHSLKSNGQTFGATELAQLARQLELGGLPQDAEALDSLRRSYEATALALRELCRE